jgi:hypothetical protein
MADNGNQPSVDVVSDDDSDHSGSDDGIDNGSKKEDSMVLAQQRLTERNMKEQQRIYNQKKEDVKESIEVELRKEIEERLSREIEERLSREIEERLRTEIWEETKKEMRAIVKTSIKKSNKVQNKAIKTALDSTGGCMLAIGEDIGYHHACNPSTGRDAIALLKKGHIAEVNAEIVDELHKSLKKIYMRYIAHILD